MSYRGVNVFGMTSHIDVSIASVCVYKCVRETEGKFRFTSLCQLALRPV